MPFYEWKLEEALMIEWKEGWIEGWKEGWKAGWAEGRRKCQENREAGRIEGIELVAKNLLAKGLPTALIQETTGLDMETIENLETRL